MSLVDLITALGKQRVYLAQGKGERLLYRAPQGVLTDALRATLARKKAGLLSLLAGAGEGSLLFYPLSYPQRSLWFLHQANTTSTAYHISLALRLLSPVSSDALREAFQGLLDHHETLRTTYCTVEGIPFQRIHERMGLCWEEVYAAGLDEAALHRQIEQAHRRPIDLERGPLMRVTLYRHATQAVLLITVHHIAMDGWSARVMLEDLAVLYNQARTGPLRPSPPACSYIDFVDWQHQFVAGAEGERQWHYWRKQLAGTLPLLTLPTDYPRPPVQTFNGGSVRIQVDEAVAGLLRELAREEQTTPFSVLLAGYLALLHHATGQEDLIVGTPTLGRSQDRFCGIIGDCINMLPLRVRLGPAESFRTLLRRARQTAHEALEYPDYPFPLLVERLQQRRNPAWPPVFQTMFNFLALGQTAEVRRASALTGSAHTFHLADLEVELYPLDQQEGQVDLALELNDGVETFAGVLRYNRDLFTESTVGRLAERYVHLLQAMAEDPDRPVNHLNSEQLGAELANNINFSWGECGSMNLEELMGALQGRDIKLWVEGGRLRVNAPAGALTPELREMLAQRKDELVVLLDSAGAPSAETPLMPISHTGPLSLSSSQQRLWFLNQMDPDNTAYHVQVTMSLRGPLNQEALEQAANVLVRRHETLRTTFDDLQGEPVQCVQEPRPVRLAVEDLTTLPAEARQAKAVERVLAENQRLFDLRQGPLWRILLLRLEPEQHYLNIVMHHIISDVWSITLFVKELLVCYEAFSGGREPELAPLPVQYADWAAWQQGSQSGPVLERELAHWRKALAGAPQTLELPADRARPTVQSPRGAWLSFRLNRELAAQVHDLARSHGATMFMALLSAFGVLLMRLTGQMDILVGSPVAGRGRRESEGLIGLFVNTIVLRLDGNGRPSFSELLARTRETALATYAHTELPFERLVEALAPQRDLSRSPIFQVMFALQTMGIKLDKVADLMIEPVMLEKGTIGARYDLTLSMDESEETKELEGSFEYNADLFDEATIRRMIGHFTTILEAAVANPDQPIQTMPLLTARERQELLVDANATAQTIEPVFPHEHFERQAARQPEAVAVLFQGETLTYGELNERANRLAHCLAERGVGPGTLVAVCLERTPEAVVALVAIHKAGGAYLPLDPTYPTDRLDMMVEDSGASFLVTQASLTERLTARDGVSRLCIDTDWKGMVAGYPAENLPPRQGLDDVAYVLYTSGSTGRPKGVAVLQRGLVNFLAAMEHEPGLRADDTLLAVTTFCFDIAELELWLPLYVGGRILLATREDVADARSLIDLINAGKATVLQCTPSTWRFLLASGWSGQSQLRGLCGGEAMLPDMARALLERIGELWNMYGPTETTIWSAVHRVTAADLERTAIPLGHPIANTQLYVLDQELEPLPVGVPGELFIGGDGLARGYLNRPELTAERFIEHPTFGRLYRTGDLVRRTPDGELEYLGRLDHQVKIRGYRIELGEIEATLAAHPAVESVVVVAREDTPGDKRLVAYLTARQGAPPLAVEPLRTHLLATLPDYMVPAAFIFMASLPLTANGKVDRRALPAPDTARPELRQEYVAPANPTEETIAAVWREVLRLEQIGVNDNFFDLGGHSLLLLQVHDRLRRVLPRELTLVEIFQHPTVRSLAGCVNQNGSNGLAWQKIQERAARARAVHTR